MKLLAEVAINIGVPIASLALFVFAVGGWKGMTPRETFDMWVDNYKTLVKKK